MNWYKIWCEDGSDGGNAFVGSSQDSLEALVARVSGGEYVRLDNLLYYDRGEIKDWDKWDKREVPMIYINPAKVLTIQQYKDDPRTLPR